MKYSTNFDNDWNFYVRHIGKFTFSAEAVPLQPLDPNGKSAKECFFRFDSTGKWLPCKEPELLRDVLTTKKSINFQIKQWVEGAYDILEGPDYYLAEFDNPPEWVKNSLINQHEKYWSQSENRERIKNVIRDLIGPTLQRISDEMA